MADLTSLRELDFYGAILIIRTHDNDADYAILEKGGLGFGLCSNASEVRYKVTKAGRVALPGRHLDRSN